MKMTEEGVESRRLGSLEWLMWLLRMNIVLVFDVEGPSLNETQISTALAALQRRHPLLRMAVVAGRAGVLSFVKSSATIPLSVARLDSWISAAEHEVNRPFTVGESPLLRAVVDLAGSSPRFMFTISHAISDGRSTSFLARDFIEALAGQTLPAKPMPSALDDHLLKGTSRLDSWREFFRFSFRNTRAMKKSGVRILPNLLHPPLGQRTFESCIVPREVPQDVAASLSSRARAESATVHSALCAAQLMALAEVFAEGRDEIPLSYVSPADLQPRIESEVTDDLVLCISGGDGIQIVRRGTSLWSLAREIRDHLHGGMLDRSALLGSLMSVRAVAGMKRWLTPDERGFRRMMRLVTASSPLATAISGKSNPQWQDAASTHRITSFWLFPSSPTVPILSLAATGNGRINWAFSFQRDLMDRHTAERVADAAVRILNEGVRA